MVKILTGVMLFLSLSQVWAQPRCESIFKASPVLDYGLFKKGYRPNYDYKVLIPDQSAVKDQCGLGTCHLYSWTSLLERDYKARTNEEIKISADYFSARHWLRKSLELLESDDIKLNLGLGEQVWMSRAAIQAYGIVPEGVWKSAKSFSSHPLSSRISGYITNIAGRARWERDQQGDDSKKKEITRKAKLQITKIFENIIGEFPKTFEYQGKTYTPQQFQTAFFNELDQPIVSMVVNHHRKESPSEYDDKSLQVVLTDLETVESTARSLLDQGLNVYLGYDHNSNYVEPLTGIMSLAAFEIPLGGGPLSRPQRDFYGLPTAGHAVQIVGYDFDPKTNQILKWKIKNSWGAAIGKEGYFHMDHDYFRAFAVSISFFKNPKITWPEVKTKIPIQSELPF